MKSIKILDGVYWVGVKDYGRRIFDALIPLPKGTSYNAYLILGSENNILIDTVNPGFEKDLEENIMEIIDLKDIDYLIMNHAEPDHAGAIPYIFNRNNKIKLVTTNIGLKMAKIFYNVPMDKVKVVKDFETINIGNKNLKFIEAPMLHWPETMFTFLEEYGVLFPCDFFGSHLAYGFWDDDVDDILLHAQRYWGEIIMPFKNSALKALEKISKLNIKIIAPSHGPIYRNPEKIIGKYWDWALGKTKEKVLIIYVSMWHYTEKLIKTISSELESQDLETIVYDLSTVDLGELAKDLVDSRAIIIGTPTVIGFAHPLTIQAAYLTKILKPPTKYAGFIITYAWGSGADKQLLEILKDLNIELIDIIKINVTPTANELELIKTFIKKVLEKVKQ